MIIEELKGRKFRRNVYGPSIWEDVIKDTYIHLELAFPPKGFDIKAGGVREFIKARTEAKKHGYVAELVVIGENTRGSYNINEIIIY